jgi:hypothetical protein
MRHFALALAFVAACGGKTSPAGGDDDGTGGGGGGGSGSGSGTSTPPTTLRGKQQALAMALRGNTDFMIGYGNDNTGPYDHDVPIGLHYVYLTGYGDEGGWPTWNTDGDYPLYFEQGDAPHDVSSWFTYYQLALELQNNNDAVLADTTRMGQYLSDMRLLFQKIAGNGTPAVVQIEPDFFGFLMQRAAMGKTPDQIPAAVSAPECPGAAQTVTGLVECVVAIGRATAPMALIGYHASQWGAYFDVTDPNADVAGSGKTVADFLLSVGAAKTDFVSVETLDRDAGFWETDGGGTTCSVTDGSRGPVYWDEANVAFPNFAQHVTWVNALTAELQLPALEWQTPLGVPSDTCGGDGGGSNGHWRDNRVHYFFGHVSDLIGAGVAGMAFGTGAGDQTDLDSDGDQLKTAASTYMGAPIAM